MKELENHIDILIAKYLAQEANVSERKEVEDWINASSGNKQYFENEQTIFTKSSNVKEWQQFDSDKAWQKLKEKIDGKSGRIVSIRPLLTWYNIAASVLLVATIGYFFLNSWNNSLQPVPWTTNAVAEVKQDTLPDGTLVFLNKSTEIAFSRNEKGNKKQVAIEGEAYFEIENKKEESFQIEVGELIIEDIGTSFNVNAYHKSELVTVIVEKGEVALYTKSDPGIRVFPGETGIFNKTTKSFAKISEADPNALAYKTRFFSFNNTLLESVISSINEVYNVNIMLSGSKLKNCRISVTFRDEKLDSILEIIADTLELKIKKVNENEIILEGEGCND